MTARKLIQLLEALPPNTRLNVEPAVISALKDKSRPQFVFLLETGAERDLGRLRDPSLVGEAREAIERPAIRSRAAQRRQNAPA